MLHNAHLPIVGFAAWSGTGKTTLLLALVPLLKARGLRIGIVKHAHHTFDVDKPGKDSFELRKAGANQMLVASRERWALMVERPAPREPTLDDTLLELEQGTLDLILVEGFKREHFPKIEVYRPSLGHQSMYPDDDSIVAIATDGPLDLATTLPVFDLNAPDTIAAYIAREIVGARDTAGNGGQPGTVESA